ncbi:MAG: extracellular solute-binding protein [bacterium]|nr:extracellular solute-binding protein [bacterium]
MTSRLWIIFPIVALLLGLLASAFLGRKSQEQEKTKGRNSQGTIELVYWGVSEPTDAMQGLITTYQELHPNVRITYVRQNREQYLERLRSRFSGGEDTSKPDIFQWHNTWKPMVTSLLASAPTDVFTETDIRTSFYPVIVKDIVQGSNILGVPLSLDGLVLLVNEDLFSSLGFKEAPKTWNEFRDVAKALTRKDTSGEMVVAGAALGTSTNVEHWSDLLGLLILQGGANPENPQGQAAEDALVFYTRFAKEDGVWNDRMDPSLVAFANGRVAMAFSPVWRIPEIIRTNPQLKFRVTPVPQLPDAGREGLLPAVSWASYWVEGVAATSPHQEEVWKFLKFATEPEQLLRLSAERTDILGSTLPFPRPDLAQSATGDQVAIAFTQQAPFLDSFPMAYGTKDNGLNDAVIAVYDEAVRAIYRGISPASVLETVRQQLPGILFQYGAK